MHHIMAAKLAPITADSCVWIVTRGEPGEGGRILGVFSEPWLALTRLLSETAELAFAVDLICQDQDTGTIRVETDLDWIALERHDLVGA
ncbi:hypothetical protein [Streptomyces luteireticuli]|uniref:hypothetical protein n=1 Tax=Streptomyces luteireticuli TaxID=173858 RepID=UPI0035571054